MEIEYKGANSLVLKSGQTTIVVDPMLSLVGRKDYKVEGSVEVVTEKRFLVDNGQKLTITGPGEYEVGSAAITGVAAKRHLDGDDESNNVTIYRITLAGIRVAVLGHIKESLSEEQLETLGVVDVLTIPVGGNGYTLDAHGAAKLVRQIDPKIVIPTHYAGEGLKYEVSQDSLELFVKELGASTSHEVQDKLKLKSSTHLPEVLTLIELNHS